MRAFILAVTGLALGVAACSSYGTSVVETGGPPAAVASVSITVPRSLQAGQTAHAVATIKDANGATLSGRALNWFSSSVAIANVDDSGEVAAIAPGNAILSAVSEGVAGQASVAVIAPPPTPTPVATVLVAISPASVLVGQRAQATATVQDSAGNALTGRVVTWQSSNAGIASVAATGGVTAVAAGTATITASSEGHSGVAPLTVNVPAPIPVASISVSPTTATLQVAGTRQLAAVTRDANNNVLTGRAVAWNSSNTTIATVSAVGLVTAVAAGAVQVSASSEGQSASSAITVTAPPPPPVPVSTVTVSPASPTLQVGDTLRFSAETRDANNNILAGRVIAWSSSNTTVATISTSGLVSTKAAGSSQITATSETKTGTTTLTVNAAPPPPPPPPPPPSGSNEPAGLTLISDQPFNSLPSSGWTGFCCAMPLDATAPKSPQKTIQFDYPAGFVSGSSPSQTDLPLSGSLRTLYVDMWIKFSPNWQGERTTMNKIYHLLPGTNNHVVICASGAGSDPLYAEVYLQGIAAGGNAGGTTGVYTSSIEYKRGQWHHVEVVAVSNTGSNRDGSVTMWVDGVLGSSATGIEFEAGGPTWTYLQLSPTWGGGGDRVTSAMWMRIDHMYVSGK